jgi:hypothetical protein
MKRKALIVFSVLCILFLLLSCGDTDSSSKNMGSSREESYRYQIRTYNNEHGYGFTKHHSLYYCNSYGYSPNDQGGGTLTLHDCRGFREHTVQLASGWSYSVR